MVELKIKNLGLIKEANLNIKPLTIFIGENNTNKSWTAYSLYAIFSRGLQRELTADYLNISEKTIVNKSEFKDFILEKAEDLTKSKAIEIKNISKVFEEYINLLLKDLSKEFSNYYISRFFKLPYKENFEKTEINVSLTNKFIEELKKYIVKSSVNISVSDKLISLYKSKGEDTLIIEGNLNDDVPIKHFKRLFIDMFIDFFISMVFINRVVFPSERKALAILEEHLTGGFIEKLANRGEIPLQVLFQFYLEKELTFPKIIEDFVKFINDLGRNYINRSKEIYEDLLKNVQDIIGGQIIYDKSVKKYMIYVPKDTNKELPVYSTSSLVKALSTFYLYIEKLASNKDLVIMDEPEMNLHPKAQAQLIEFLTMFVNWKRKDGNNFLIFTTHTPYILDHLENLIDAYDLKKKLKPKVLEKLKNKFLLKSDLSFISSDMVEVYYFSKNKKPKSIFDRKNNRFNKDTFSELNEFILDLEDILLELEEEESDAI